MIRLCVIRRCRRWPLKASGQRGVVLVGMIVVLFLISSLVVAMMSQSTSTAFSLAYENSSNRAYYLAESGFRYAVARIRHGADMKTDLHLHGSFSLANSAGSFDLSLFPHYLETTSAVTCNAATACSLTGSVPGGYDNGAADALAFSDGEKVRIVTPDGTWDAIQDYTTASLTSTEDATTGKYTATVTLTGIVFSPTVSVTLPAGTVILPVAQADGDQASVGSDDGSNGTVALNVTAGSIDAFPKYNGTFRIDGQSTLYAYLKKDGDTLAGITAPLDDTLSPPFSFSDGDNIVLERFVRIESAGTFRNATRNLTFHLPLATPEATETLTDTFGDLDNWATPGQGSFIASGGKAKVDTVSTEAVASTKAAQIQLKSGGSAPVSLENSWRYGNAGYLGYDAQVKVGFDFASTSPADGTTSFGGDTIPNYYMAGLNFRVRDIESSTEKKSYGLSFMRGPGSSYPISGHLVPSANKHLLVLWQQTGATETDLQWLAYKDMNPTFYSDDMETTWSPKSLYRDETEITWTNDANWSVNTSSGCGGSSNSWKGNVANSFFVFVNDYLTTGNMDLSHTTQATLKFCQKYQLRSSAYGWVYISNNGGSTWYLLSAINNAAQSSWAEQEYDISAYLPSDQVQVLFRIFCIGFRPGSSNWFVDDVRVSKEIPVQDSTLVARVQEAPVAVFSGGTVGTNGREIEKGDQIYRTEDGASATVDAPPIVTSGSWTDGDPAEGLLLLRNVKGDFTTTNNKTFSVIGGQDTAITQKNYSSRENLIRAFIADKTGEGTNNTVATDYLKLGLPVGTFKWPPEDEGSWPAALDYFTLVQWDAVNQDGSLRQPWSDILSGTSISNSKFSWVSSCDADPSVHGCDGVYDAILSNALVSPDTGGSYNHAELGLHAFGDGAESTYFDDFGVKLDIGAQYRYAPVVQE